MFYQYFLFLCKMNNYNLINYTTHLKFTKNKNKKKKFRATVSNLTRNSKMSHRIEKN